MRNYIKSVSGVAFKGPNFNYDLSPVTLVYGDNFLGKSRIGQAIRLALLGYDPELGDRAVFDFASGPLMQVQLDTTLGNLARQWEQKPKRGGGFSISPTDRIPPAFEGMSSILNDLNTYFEYTKADRIRHVFELSGAKLDLDGVVTSIKTAKVFDDTAKMDPKLLELQGDTLAHSATEVEEIDRDYEGNAIGLADKLMAWFDAKLLEAKKSVDAYSKTDTGNTTLMAGTVPVNVETELAGCAKDLENENVRLRLASDYNARKDALKARENELTEAKLKASIGNHEQDLKRKKEIMAAIENNKEPACFQELREAEAELKTSQANLDERKDNLQACQDTIKSTKAAKCHECNQKLPPARVKAMLADQQVELKKVTRDLQSAEKHVAHLEGTIKVLKQKTSKAEKLKDLTGLSSELDRINTAISSRKSWSDAIPRYEKMVREAKATLDAAKRSGDSQVVDLEALRKRHDELKHKNNEWIKYGQDKLRIEQAREKRAAAEIELACHKEIIAIITRVQQQAVDKAFAGIVDRAQLFCDGILPSRLCYQDGDVGRMRDGRFVKHTTFTDGERIVAHAGLAVALAGKSPIKIVIIDRLESLTAKHQLVFATRMNELIQQGVIDQCLLIMASVKQPEWTKTLEPGLKVHEIK